jgi:signal transduction histidine kinase
MSTVPFGKSIRTIIFVGFGTMSLLVGGLGAYGIYGSDRAGRVVADTYDYPLMAINFARAASLDFARMSNAPLPAPRAPPAAQAKLDELEESFFADLKVAEQRATHPQAVAVIGDIKALVERWGELRHAAASPASSVELDRLSEAIVDKFDLLIELTAEQSFVERRKAISGIAALKWLGIASSAVALLLSGLIAFLLSRRIIRPLSAAAMVANRIAAGDLQTPIRQRGDDETGLLLRSMAVMQDNIRVMVELEAAARGRAEQDRERAESANRAKSQFLANMSHELRTPLNAVLGFAQVLEMNAKEPLTTRQARHVGQIRKSGRHLLSLIDEVLDLSKIEIGNIKLDIEQVSLGPVLDQVRATLQPLAAEAGVSLTVGVPGDLAVAADRTRLFQILINLGSNAIKYSHRGGRAALDAGRGEAGRIRLSVVDDGVGIPLHRQSELFQLFNRLGAEETAVQGAGIGLALSHRLTLLMKGQLTLQSAPGTGTTVTLELPAAKTAPAAPVATGGGAAPADHRDGYTLLYVEDDAANIMLMQGLADGLPNVRLLIASNAEDGLLLARAQSPDIIVLDINLPGMDGFAMLEQLKRTPATARIPVMALSASAMPSAIAQGRAAGFAHYLTKPIDVDQFLALIDELLGAPV